MLCLSSFQRLHTPGLGHLSKQPAVSANPQEFPHFFVVLFADVGGIYRMAGLWYWEVSAFLHLGYSLGM